MSYREKPQLKLYKFQDNTFILQAIIDDYQEVSFERNLYQAGVFSISINFNIPNSQLFQRGLFVQFGSDPYDFGEIITIKDQIGEAGKGSQLRTIMGYDSRYIFKKRVIKNMNSNGLWTMMDKGELCLRNLINDQCGTNAEEKRKLPITNIIPDSSSAIGKEYSVSEQFTNLYEVCKTIATQSEIGWRLNFNGTSLSLECYEGEDRSQTVQFSPSFDSLANGNFQDSSESFSNAIYVGGKGQNDDRDIYEGEDGTPSGLNRFESWDNQSSMTSEDEYEAEALSMLTQYGQTIQMSGNGLAKCPYEYKSQYNVGDWITISFNNKSAIVQILSVTEHWLFGSYNIQFSFGKPQNNIQDQLQLMLRKIQSASNKTNSTDSVRWYTIPTDTEMPKADVTYNTLGFTGSGGTFTLYLDDEKTGSKSYHLYIKNLTASLVLTTGRGATDLTLISGSYIANIFVDEDGNIINQGMTATNSVESGNTQPVTSDAVYDAISSAIGTNPDVSNATGVLPIAHGGTNATTEKGAEYNLIGGVETVETEPNDNRYIALRNQTVSASNGTFRWTKMSSVWNWIKSKIQNVALTIGTTTSAITETLYGSLTIKNSSGSTRASISQDGVVNGYNLPLFSSVYSNSNYSSGYYLVAQLEGGAYSGNHDVSFEGTVYSDRVGNISIADFFVYVRGNGANVGTKTFIKTCRNLDLNLRATYEVFDTNKFRIKLYAPINGTYHRITTLIKYATSGDVSPRASNLTVTFPNTQSSAISGTEITATKVIVGDLNGTSYKIRTSAPSSPANGDIWIS